jgi:hypothetical protein
MPLVAASIVPAATNVNAQQAQPKPPGRINAIQIIVPPADQVWPSFEGTLFPREETLEVSARCPGGLIRMAIAPRAPMGSRLLRMSVDGRDLPAESRTRIEYVLRLETINSAQVSQCGTSDDPRIRIRIGFDGVVGPYAESFDVVGRHVVLHEESGVEEFAKLHPPGLSAKR